MRKTEYYKYNFLKYKFLMLSQEDFLVPLKWITFDPSNPFINRSLLKARNHGEKKKLACPSRVILVVIV